MTQSKMKAKLVLLHISSFVVSILPIVLIVAFNWNHYVKTPSSTVSLAVGGSLAMLFLLAKALGKLPDKTKRVVKYGVFFGLVILLDPIIQDLKILSGGAFLGELLDSVFFERQIKKLKQNLQADNTATMTVNKISEQVEALVDERLEGRV